MPRHMGVDHLPLNLTSDPQPGDYVFYRPDGVLIHAAPPNDVLQATPAQFQGRNSVTITTSPATGGRPYLWTSHLQAGRMAILTFDRANNEADQPTALRTLTLVASTDLEVNDAAAIANTIHKDCTIVISLGPAHAATPAAQLDRIARDVKEAIDEAMGVAAKAGGQLRWKMHWLDSVDPALDGNSVVIDVHAGWGRNVAGGGAFANFSDNLPPPAPPTGRQRIDSDISF